MLKCSRCKQAKPGTLEFFPPHKHKVNGLDSWCRDCRSVYRKERRLPRGIAANEVPRAYAARGIEACIICGSKENLVIDHDHKTGMVRGSLCMHCNLGLGHFKDDPELLEFAALYLRGQCACGKCTVTWGGLPLFSQKEH